jgi:hypothetical protein
MLVTELPLQEQTKTGCTHVAVIDYTDLVAAGATTATTLNLLAGRARDIVENVRYDLITPFDGGATSTMTLDVGYDLATGTDDPDAFVDAEVIHADGTEILASVGTGTKLAAQAAYDVEAVFTATDGNLNALTTGKIAIYFKIVRLPDLRGIND